MFRALDARVSFLLAAAVAGLLVFGSACGGAASGASQDEQDVRSRKSDFALGNPGDGEADPGDVVDGDVDTWVTKGSAQTLTFSASGLPAGANAIFTPATLVAGGTAHLEIDLAKSTAAGDYTITVTAKGTATTHSVQFVLTVSGSSPPPAADDFTISGLPDSASVVVGKSATIALASQVASGRNQRITWSIEGLGGGVSASFTPTQIVTGYSTTLAVSASSSALAGTYALTVVAQGDYATHRLPLKLVVDPDPSTLPNDFSVSGMDSAPHVLPGRTKTWTLATAITAGKVQTVRLSISGLPSGATSGFAPSVIAAGGQSVLTVAFDRSVQPGAYNVSLVATGDTVTHNIPVALTVDQLPAATLPFVGFNDASAWILYDQATSDTVKFNGDSVTMDGHINVIDQIFTVPAAGGTLWFQTTCVGSTDNYDHYVAMNAQLTVIDGSNVHYAMPFGGCSSASTDYNPPTVAHSFDFGAMAGKTIHIEFSASGSQYTYGLATFSGLTWLP
jgi:hypothetical protein